MNKFVRGTDRAAWPNGLMILLFTATFGVFFAGMPLYADDFWYSINIKDWVEGRSGDIPWQGIYDTWYDHYVNDNARVGNVVYLFFLLMPKWVGSLLAALVLGAAVTKGFGLAGAGWRRSALVPAGLAMWSFLPAWYDSIGSMCYQFNYVMPTGLGVWLCAVWFSPRPARGCLPWAAFLAGLVTGCWHEGFGLSLLCGLGGTYILYPSLRTRRSLCVMAGLLAGLSWIFLAPSFMYKYHAVTGENVYGLSRLVFVSVQHPALFAMLAAAAVSLSRRAWRRRVLADPLSAGLLLSDLASFGIEFFTQRVPRAAWWCDAASILLFLRLCVFTARRYWDGYSPRNIVPAALLGLAALAHQAAVDYYALRIRRAFHAALAEHAAHPGKTVFADVVTEHDAPLICWFMPDFTLFLAPTYYSFANMYYHDGDDDRFLAVPSELRGVTRESGHPVPGNTGLRETEGRLFMPTDSVRMGEFAADVDFGPVARQGVRMIYYPFVSEADGRRYAYVYPWRRVIEMRIGGIRSVNIPTD